MAPTRQYLYDGSITSKGNYPSRRQTYLPLEVLSHINVLDRTSPHCAASQSLVHFNRCAGLTEHEFHHRSLCHPLISLASILILGKETRDSYWLMRRDIDFTSQRWLLQWLKGSMGDRCTSDYECHIYDENTGPQCLPSSFGWLDTGRSGVFSIITCSEQSLSQVEESTLNTWKLALRESL